jgi:hypothetical protein
VTYKNRGQSKTRDWLAQDGCDHCVARSGIGLSATERQSREARRVKEREHDALLAVWKAKGFDHIPANQTIYCMGSGCSSTFTFTVGEQIFFKKKGFTTPRRCPTCRASRPSSGTRSSSARATNQRAAPRASARFTSGAAAGGAAYPNSGPFSSGAAAGGAAYPNSGPYSSGAAAGGAHIRSPTANNGAAAGGSYCCVS